MNNSHDTASLTLRNLPLPVRLTLAVFLIAAGLGYFAGLVQMHFAHATAGNLLPSATETVEIYHGPLAKAAPMSKLEKLLVTHEGPFTGAGTMRPAFFEKSGGWKSESKDRGEEVLRKERETEVEIFLHWMRNGAGRDAYEAKRDDAATGEYPIPEALAKRPLTAEFKAEKEGKPVALIRDMFVARCVECHSPDAGHPDKGNAPNYPLETYDQIAKYLKVEEKPGGMSLEKLAMTTHAHWLSFAMLFLLTGAIFSFTSYPVLVRCVFGPLTLLAQMVDISFWWLARYDPNFGYGILITGGIVAVSLCVQILGSLFNLFGGKGKLVLLLLMVATGAGGAWLWGTQIQPYLQQKGAVKK